MKWQHVRVKKGSKGESVTKDILDVVRDSQGPVGVAVVFTELDDVFEHPAIEAGINKLIEKGYVIAEGEELRLATGALSKATDRLKKMREQLKDELSMSVQY